MKLMRCLIMMAGLLSPALAAGEELPVNWQEAVGTLASERTRAEGCASALKRHGGPAAISQGELAYSEAKADVDGVIAALIVSLAEDAEPGDWSALEDQMKQGFAKRLAFCETVQELIPEDEGKKGGIIELIGGVAGSVIEAAAEIFLDSREADRLTRKTIQTQLEAAKWPSFSDIASSS
ncbi:MAG: hypothetical protein ACR2QF_09615 [Geminicoccaceae bacterium]